MGFSDSQVSPMIAHKHTAAANDGGNLDSTSLLPDAATTAVQYITRTAMLFGAAST